MFVIIIALLLMFVIYCTLCASKKYDDLNNSEKLLLAGSVTISLVILIPVVLFGIAYIVEILLF